jgi:hypothetical protein
MTVTVGTNSYISLVDAGAYLADRYGYSIWDAEADQEAALISSARLLDNQLKWLQSKTVSTQAMQWPRSTFDAYTTTEIPQIVKDAQCELAFDIAEKGGIRAGFDASGDLKRIKADTVELEYRNKGVQKPDTSRIPDHIKKMLRGLIEGTRVIRLQRA